MVNELYAEANVLVMEIEEKFKLLDSEYWKILKSIKPSVIREYYVSVSIVTKPLIFMLNRFIGC